MAYKHSTNAMKKLTFMMLLAARMTMIVLLILWNSSMESGKPLRLKLTEHGMMLPNTHTLVLVWILLSMKVVDTMALAT